MFIRKHIPRFYEPGSIYFITANTKDRIQFFNDYGCCKILLETIRLTKLLMAFDLYAFIIMPDHLHLLICPKGNKNISQILHFIKRHVSRDINNSIENNGFIKRAINVDINDVDAINVVEVREPPLRTTTDPRATMEIIKYYKSIENIKINSIEKFSWQKSFYDHMTRSEKEFQQTIDYINEKNLQQLHSKYHLLTEDQLADYPFYSLTNTDLIDPIL